MPGEDDSGPTFIGRKPTVDALRHRLDEVASGHNGVTFLVGPAGVGKSLLATEIAKEARVRGFRVAVGRSPAVDNPSPFALIRSALETLGAEPVLSAGTAGLPSPDSALPDLAPRLAQVDAAPRAGIEQRLLKALDETEERGRRARDHTLAQISAGLLELADKGPALIVFEDIDRADDPSLGAVQHFLGRVERRPVWVLATSRPAPTLSAGRRLRLEQLEREVRPEVVSLRPFIAPEVAEFLRGTDPPREPPGPEVAVRLAETAGNPLLLEQFARRRAAGLDVVGVLAPGRPPLPARLQRVLDEASVLGPQFTLELLSKVSAAEASDLRRSADELLARGALLERPDGVLEFPEDRIRERAYGHLEEGSRRLLHQRAAEAKEASPAPDQNRIFGLARDFYLGEGDRRSVEYNRIAAEIAERASAPDVAREFLEHALENQRDASSSDLEAEAELVLELARVSLELGRLEEAEKEVRRFLETYRGDPALPGRLQNSLEIFLVRVLTAQGHLEEATSIAERVLLSPDIAQQPTVQMGAHAQLRYSLYYAGRYSEALDQNTEVIRLALEAGDARVMAYAKLWRAGCLAMIGQGEEALLEARQVAVAFDRLGTTADSAAGHLFLGNMLADDRSTPAIRQEALAELRKTIRLAAEAQDPRRVGWAFYHSAELLRFEHRPKEAADNAAQAVLTLTRIGDQVGQAVSIKVRGQLAMEEGDLKAAEADLAEAHRILGSLHNTVNEIDVVLRLAQLALAKGDPATVRQRLSDLERLDLPKARPDLAPEFEKLRDAVAKA